MKGRSSRLPTCDPPDDWVNGSWTVDCICGVNFDDGEEMVNCDECGVWVHTRCSRFVRGEKSFACDKCKSKNSRSSRNDSEETEVAQLLVELPTKTIKMSNPFPLSSPPPPPPTRHPYRLWTDRPIEQRVHVQGVPGGDPALFGGLSSIFSSELWKCTGYVPKKFNFCYREFPSWDDVDIKDKAEGDSWNQNSVDKGADVLYSLSKEISMRGQDKASSSDKYGSKDRKLDGHDSKNNNPVKKEKARPIVLQCGKRNRDDLGPSKDRSGKKKTKAVHKGHESKKEKGHALKTVVIHSTNARQVQVYESKAHKFTKADAPSDKNELGNDNGFLDVTPNAHLTGTTEKRESDAATDEGVGTPSSIGFSSDKRVKGERVGHTASDQDQKCAKTETVSLPSLEKDGLVRIPTKKEGLVFDDMGRDPGLHTETPNSDILKSKSFVEGESNAALEVKDAESVKNLVANRQLSPSHCNSKSKLDSKADNPKEVLQSHPSDIVAKSDKMKDSTGQFLSADHVSENSKNSETPSSGCQSHEDERQKGDMCLEEAGDCQYKKADETTDSPCNIKRECNESEKSIENSRIPLDTKEISGVAGETSKAVVPSTPSEQNMMSVGKSPSSPTIVSRSSNPDKNRHSQNPSSIGKRMLSNSTTSAKKDNAAVDPMKHEDKREKPKSSIKDHPKSSVNPVLKAPQSSRASSSPVFKHYTSVGKDPLRHPSSKSYSNESSSVQSDVGEPAASLQTQHELHLQNKSIASSGQQRDEKVNQSNSQSSSKSTLSSFGHLPASSNSPAGLSDEELALLLHQELNSSPRVPRVPRIRHAGSLPQLSSVGATSMLIKRTTGSGGKDQHTFSRRKSRDIHKDGSRSSRERDNEIRKVDRLPSSPDSAKTSNAATQVEVNNESLHPARKDVEPISTSAVSSGPSFTDANELKNSSTRDSPGNNSEDDTGANRGAAPTYRTLPGLIAEIMGKGRRMTYEELCNAVLPHWQNLRKHNGERYAYSSHSQAVLDCLRNRTEWARLVDRGPKTNAGRKKRKVDVEPPNTESEDGEDRTFKNGDSKSVDSNKEEFPKGKRRARIHKRLTLQGRSIRDDRKRKKVEVGSDETGSFANSSEDSVSSEDDSQGSGMCAGRSEVSASSDGLEAVS